jgi:hypothetical protein
MKRSHFKHLPHYLPLLGIFGAGALAFFLFSYDKQFQIGVAISVAAAHLVWGIFHHLAHRDLAPEIVLEYLAVSALGLAAILSVILHS